MKFSNGAVTGQRSSFSGKEQMTASLFHNRQVPKCIMLSADNNSELEWSLVPRLHEDVKSIDFLAPPGPSEQPFPGVARCTPMIRRTPEKLNVIANSFVLSNLGIAPRLNTQTTS